MRMLQAFSGGEFFGARFGTGTPWLLALHGWQRSHVDFSAVLSGDATRPPIDAIALDLPGFGATPPPPEAWGTMQYATHVASVLSEMEEKVVVLGHSFGAIVATQLAQVAPDRIAGLVLTGAPFFRAEGQTAKSPLRYRMIRLASRRGLLPEKKLEQARERYGSTDYRNATGVMRGVLVARLSENYDELLAKTTVPVELVWGENDTAAPLSAAQRANEILSHSSIVVLDGIDHFTTDKAPGALRDAVERMRP